MKILESGETKVFALGGLGEVGKNMYVIMYNNEIIIIDSGVLCFQKMSYLVSIM